MIGSLGYIQGEDMNDKFMLISLVARLYSGYSKVKKGSMMDMMKHYFPTEDKDYIMLYSNLCDVTQELMYGCTNIDNCGYNTSREAIEKIKEIISRWIPY